MNGGGGGGFDGDGTVGLVRCWVIVVCTFGFFMCCFLLAMFDHRQVRCVAFCRWLFGSGRNFFFEKILHVHINSTGGPTSKICERTGAGDTGVYRDNRVDSA